MTETNLIHVNIGEVKIARGPKILKATLGSCVGVALYFPPSDVFGLAHVLLPQSNPGKSTMIQPKFADHALRLLIRMMRIPKSEQDELLGVLAGGANMFSRNRRRHIRDVGRENVEAIRRLTQDLGVRILGEDLLGKKARSMAIDTKTGTVSSWYVLGNGNSSRRRLNLEIAFVETAHSGEKQYAV